MSQIQWNVKPMMKNQKEDKSGKMGTKKKADKDRSTNFQHSKDAVDRRSEKKESRVELKP
uniref:Uncharacterized protein n=1 Tax=Oryza nivara TaxID=4536 RepID=A0A0E0FL26_ORYNI